MRSSLFFLLFITFFACNSDSQNSNASDSPDSLNQSVKAKDVVRFTEFEIDSVQNIEPGVNQKSSVFIKKRLEQLIGNSYKKRCEEINVNYPPKYVMYRAFKYEREYEIWVADSRTDTLKLLITIPICAVDKEPGPKLQRGDGKTPEGFYTCQLLYGSSNWFMWIKLNNSTIYDYGDVGVGSSFKLCLEYPLQIDKSRTRKFSGSVSPGSAICVHGNCVTAGCISFENKDFLPVFLSAGFHNSKLYGYPKIHIFPFRFTEKKKEQFSKEVYSDMKPEDLINFWNEIQKAYDLFEKNHKAIKVSFTNNKYNFIEY